MNQAGTDRRAFQRMFECSEIIKSRELGFHVAHRGFWWLLTSLTACPGTHSTSSVSSPFTMSNAKKKVLLMGKSGETTVSPQSISSTRTDAICAACQRKWEEFYARCYLASSIHRSNRRPYLADHSPSPISSNQLARDTHRLGATIDVEHSNVRFLGSMVLVRCSELPP